MLLFELIEYPVKKTFLLLYCVIGFAAGGYSQSWHELNDSAIRAYEAGDDSNALKLMQQAYRQAPLKDTVYASLATHMARLYQLRGNYDAAGSLLQETATLYSQLQGEKHPNYLRALSNLAVFYATLGDFASAEPLLQQVVLLRSQNPGKTHPDYATALYNLGALYHEMGNYDAAYPLLQESLELRQTHFSNHHPITAESMSMLADVYTAQQQYDLALPLYLKALTICKNIPEKKQEYTTILNNLGNMHYRRGNKTEAGSIYQRVVTLTRERCGTQHPDYARSLNNLGNFYRSMGRYDRAAQCLQEALVIYGQVPGKKHPHYAICLNNLAGVLHLLGKYQPAENLYRESVQLSLSHLQNNFSVLSEKEREFFYAGSKTCFENFTRFAVSCALISPHHYLEQTTAFQELSRLGINPYQKATEQVLSKTALGDLYNLQLMTRGMLLQATSRMRNLILSSGDSALTGEFKRWQQLRGQLAGLYQSVQKQNVDIELLEKQANELEKSLSRRSAAFAQMQAPRQVSWQEVRSKLAPNEAAVEMMRFRYFNDSIMYGALVITARCETPELVILPGGGELEGKNFRAYRNYMNLHQSDPDSYGHYWKPLKEKLPNISKLYFSPDGVYHQINLNTLMNPETGGYLIDEIEIQMVTSTKDLLDFVSPAIPDVREAWLLGRPAYHLEVNKHRALAAKYVQTPAYRGAGVAAGSFANRSIDDLPGTEKEINGIKTLLESRQWKTHVFLGVQALEEEVKKISNPAVLHIATHGFFVSQGGTAKDLEKPAVNEPYTDPMLRSGLLLTGAATYGTAAQKYPAENGILTAYEMMNMNLDSTKLVILSACETGAGEVRAGEGVYGLQRAIKVAGAKTLVMSLWRVDDRATQQLMYFFYEQWSKTGDTRAAFKAAQQQLRKMSVWEHPYFWGAFVTIGQ